jgi:hypothetical protein
MKIYQVVQKLLVGDTQSDTDRQTDRQTGDLMSLLSFLLSPLDSYITSDPFALGSLIALMMEAARTSETSVDIQLRAW